MRRLALVLILAAFPAPALAVGKILAEVACPVAEPMGMTADGDNLVISDLTTRTIARVRAADGAVLARIAAPADMPMGLALHDGTLYAADRALDWIARLRPGAPDLATIPFYEQWPYGLAHDGKHLWVVNAQKARLHEIDPEDGTTIRTFEAPANAPTGLAFDGKYLWVADHGTDEIYMVDRRDGSVVMSIASPGPYPSALAFAGGALWVADYQTRKLYKLSLSEDAPYVEDKERRIHASYEVTYRPKGAGKVTSLVGYLAIPRDIPGQHVLGELTFDPKPARFDTDQYGQKVAVFELGTVEVGQVRRVRWEGDFAVFRTCFQVFPEKLETAKSESGLAQYLTDDVKYDLSSPIVTDLVEKLTKGKKTRWDKARAIYEYLAKTISYDRSGGWNNAAAVLERGNGSCSEYTFALVALLRKAGIPARYVGAISERGGDEASFDDVFHRWAEAYFPGYGWVPIDANAAHGAKPGERGFYFGGRSNRHVVTTVGGGNSKLMGWTYGHNETYHSEGGATLETDGNALGRFRPLK
jgi:transglutaminase-like putative cysteine protease